jgi:hypothetical protein
MEIARLLDLSGISRTPMGWSSCKDCGMLGAWKRMGLKTRQSSLAILWIRNGKMLSHACLSMLSRSACTTATRCPKAEVMSEPRINHLTDFALFLPFSCNERQQRGASRCNAETLEVVDKAEETGLYG